MAIRHIYEMERLEFEHIAKIIRPKLKNKAFLILHDEAEAEDIVQDALLKLWTIRKRYKTAVFDWNFGLGVELFEKFQVGVNYGLALTNAYETFGFKGQWTDIDSKKNSWTISATYMF